MPTRSEFLQTGLVPILSKSTNSDECAICCSELTDPVQTPCNHLFDRACITQWLSGEKHNTCPLCKTVLFDLPPEETMTRAERRRHQVSQALFASNVISRQPPFDDFGSTRYDVSSLQRAVAHASYCLNYNQPFPTVGEPIQVDVPGVFYQFAGPCEFELRPLTSALIAMANLLPALAEAQGTPIAGGMDGMWRLVCQDLLGELRGLSGRKMDASVLPAMLKNSTRRAMLKRGQSGWEAALGFFEDGPDAEWFDMLVSYVVFRAWLAWVENERRRDRLREEADSLCVVM